MPHQCTNCGHTFADGSKEMLSGCPGCGGNKFQFHPDEVPAEPPDDAEPPAPEGDDAGVAGAVGRAANTVRDIVGRSSSDGPPGAGAPGGSGPAASGPDAAGGATAGPDGTGPDGTAAPAESTPGRSASTVETTDAVETADAGEASETAPGNERGGADDDSPPETNLEHVGELPEEKRYDALVTHADDDAPESTTDELLEKEWPEVSRPDDGEDAAQASARSELFGTDDEDVAVEGSAGDDRAADTGGATDNDAGDATESEAGDRPPTDSEDGTADDAGPSPPGEQLGDITIAAEEPLPIEEEDADADVDDVADTPGTAQTPTSSGETPEETKGVGGPRGADRDGDDGTRPADISAGSGADSPDLADLRRELNEQFESIKIVEKGQYELNLMELYEREEYIISLQEDGRYVIEVPDTWRE